MFALSSYIPFMDNANRLYIKRFCFTQTGAGQAIMIPYLMCVIVSPFFGILIDKVGKRRYFIISTLLVFFFAHFFILVYPSCQLMIEKGSVLGLVFIGNSFLK
jgi:MFS family permease